MTEITHGDARQTNEVRSELEGNAESLVGRRRLANRKFVEDANGERWEVRRPAWKFEWGFPRPIIAQAVVRCSAWQGIGAIEAA